VFVHGSRFDAGVFYWKGIFVGWGVFLGGLISRTICMEILKCAYPKGNLGKFADPKENSLRGAQNIDLHTSKRA